MWRKLGHVYGADGSRPWAASSAYLPTSRLLGDDRIRVYAAFLDDDKVGRVGWVDVDARDPTRVLAVSPEPALDVGEPGTFDDSGVNPVSLVEHDGRLLLYYIGWQRGVRVRYFLFVGLAVSDDGGETFARHSRVPVLERSDRELSVRSAPSVRHDGERWQMWYVGDHGWTDVDGKEVPTYTVRYLESPDGVTWGDDSVACLRLDEPDEYGFGRPFVMADGDRYRMWYSIRSRSLRYRMGYAESPDGVRWTRMDDRVGIDVSEDGWDAEMICCGCVQPTPHGVYLLYNGNGYGADGFGAAVADPAAFAARG